MGVSCSYCLRVEIANLRKRRLYYHYITRTAKFQAVNALSSFLFKLAELVCFPWFTPLSIWQVNTPRICARLIWAISEHIDLEGLDPLLADDPEDPLNIIISNIHKVLFSVDSSTDSTNRLLDVQAVLLCAQRMGSRNPRAGQLLTKEIEEFRNSSMADSVNKHQCRLILQRLKYASSHPERR